ncbi:MAG: tetratricopeptide repeat protein [Patescibacteria group bacterium]|nr:tetratricopeptide repeat protein [Patescibacteria group bacterium]
MPRLRFPAVRKRPRQAWFLTTNCEVSEMFDNSCVKLQSRRPDRPRRLARWLLIVGASSAMGAVSNAAAPDAITQIQALAAQGHVVQARKRLDKLLAAHPKDPKYLFVSGVLLAQEHKVTAAIDVFTRLTEQYPELPEPYNDLAVLYAQQGQFEKARAALESAIRTNPSYEIAFHNLGDVYAVLASQSYKRALQLDSGRDASARANLALISRLLNHDAATHSAMVASSKDTAPTFAATVASLKKHASSRSPVAASTNSSPASEKRSAASLAAKAQKVPVKAAPVAVAKPATSPAAVATAALPQPPAQATDQKLVEAAVERWAHAWQSRDLSRYFASYLPGYTPDAHQTHAAWVARRTLLIKDKRRIRIEVRDLHVKIDADRAIARFRQIYTSGPLHFDGMKTLHLVRRGKRWYISEERVG